MLGGRRQKWVENSFVLLLAILCAILTVLQFRWTGELAKAEMERLGGRQEESARDLVTDFETRVRRTCDALVPLANQMNEAGLNKRLHEYRATNPRPILRKLALAIPKDGELQLQLVSMGDGSFSPMEWPAEWAALRDNLSRKFKGGSPPYTDEKGLLLEFPIRSGEAPLPPSGGPSGPPPDGEGVRGPGGQGGPPPDGPGGGGHGGPGGPRGFGEVGWMILELDPAYIADVWIHDLEARYFNRGHSPIYQIKILSLTGTPLFQTGLANAPGDPVIRLPFNAMGRGGGRLGPAAESRWILEVRRPEGGLERLVAESRRRNIFLAVFVNAMILAAGLALVRYTRKSRKLVEEKMNFVASVSHELRTPLTVIRGAAHNIKRGIVKTPEALDRYSGMILQHTDQLSEMVGQVLDFAVAKKGKLLGEQKQRIALAALLEEAVANTRGETAFCKVEVTLPVALPEVAGDPGHLRRAFQNLIANAAKHGGSGGWIGISARRVGSQVEVAVADRGQGIPKEEQTTVFNPFFRGNAAHSAQVRGSGLGLSLVKEIIEAHDGTISICSAPGEGATFVASLPVAAGQ